VLRWIARAYLIAGAIALVGGVVTGVVLERELWTPELTGTAQGYNDTVVAHGWFGIALFTPAALAGFAYLAVDDVKRPAIGWLGFALWVVAIAIAAWLVASPPEVLMAASDDGRVVAMRYMAGASGLVSAVHVAGGARERPVPFLIVLGLASVLAVVNLASQIPLLFAAVALAITALAAGRGTAVAIYASGALLAALGDGFTTVIVAHSDIYLADTYALVGIQHLLAMTLVLAMLAAVHAWPLVRRTPRGMPATAGALLVTAGSLAMCAAMVYTGMQGMPRRYMAYEPQMALGHRLTAIDAGIAIVGLGVVIFAWVMAPRETA